MAELLSLASRTILTALGVTIAQLPSKLIRHDVVGAGAGSSLTAEDTKKLNAQRKEQADKKKVSDWFVVVFA